MFDEFKAKHGGLGPFQIIGDVATHHAITNAMQAHAVGQQMDATLEGIQNDETLTPEFKKKAGQLMQHGIYDTGSALKNIDALTGEARDQHVIIGTTDRQLSQLDQLAAGNTDPANAKQYSAMRVAVLNSRDAALSTNPELQKQGFAGIHGLDGTLQQFLATDEQQAINAKNTDAELQRNLGNDQYSRYKDLRADQQKLGTLAEQQRADVLAYGAGLASPQSAARDLSLLRTAMRISNPGAQIRPGETADAENTGGIPEAWLTVYNRIQNGGGRLDTKELGELTDLVHNQTGAINQGISDRNADAAKAARAAGIKDTALIDSLMTRQIGVEDQIARAGNAPAQTPPPGTPPPPPGSPPSANEIAKTAMAVVAGAGELAESLPEPVKMALGIAAAPSVPVALGSIPAAAGAILSTPFGSAGAMALAERAGAKLAQRRAQQRAGQLPTDETASAAGADQGVW